MKIPEDMMLDAAAAGATLQPGGAAPEKGRLKWWERPEVDGITELLSQFCNCQFGFSSFSLNKIPSFLCKPTDYLPWNPFLHQQEVTSCFNCSLTLGNEHSLSHHDGVRGSEATEILHSVKFSLVLRLSFFLPSCKALKKKRNTSGFPLSQDTWCHTQGKMRGSGPSCIHHGGATGSLKCWQLIEPEQWWGEALFKYAARITLASIWSVRKKTINKFSVAWLSRWSACCLADSAMTSS